MMEYTGQIQNGSPFTQTKSSLGPHYHDQKYHSTSQKERRQMFRPGPVPAFHPDQQERQSPNNSKSSFHVNWGEVNRQNAAQSQQHQAVQNIYQVNVRVNNGDAVRKVRAASVYQPSSIRPYQRRPYSGQPKKRQSPTNDPRDDPFSKSVKTNGQFYNSRQLAVDQTISMGSPGNISNKVTRRQKVYKMLPNQVRQTKEDLYEIALNSKIEVNNLNEENRRLQTRIQFMETQLGLQDATGQVVALKRQLKDTRLAFSQKDMEIEGMKRQMQYTNINELKQEVEITRNELQRMRLMCDQVLLENRGLEEQQKDGVQGVDIVRNQLDQAQAQISQLHKHMSAAKQHAKQQAQQIHDLKLKKSQFEEDKEELVIQIQSLHAKHESEVSKVHKNLNASQEMTQKRHQQDLNQLKQDYEDKIKDLQQKHNKQLLDQMNEVAQLQEQEAQKQLQDQTADKQKADSYVKNMEVSKLEMETQITDLTKRLEAAQNDQKNQADQHDKALNQYQAQIVEINEKCSQAEEQTKKMDARVIELQKELQDAKSVLKESAPIQNQDHKEEPIVQASPIQKEPKEEPIVQASPIQREPKEEPIVQASPKQRVASQKVLASAKDSDFNETFSRASSIKPASKSGPRSMVAQSINERSSIKSSIAEQLPVKLEVASPQVEAPVAQQATESVDYEDQYSSDGANYRVEIDSEKIRNQIKQDQQKQEHEEDHLAMDDDYLLTEQKGGDQIDDYDEDDEFNDARDTDSDQQPSNQELTAKSPVIYHALLTLKRVCQIKQLKFDEIETFLFGKEYRPEQRILQSDLAELLAQKLHLQPEQAQLFAKYLSEQGSSLATKGTETSKVLQCKVVATLCSNLNIYCAGIIHYSVSKIRKMTLIVGQALNVDDINANDFDELSFTLGQMGLGKETMDCALVELLKLSQSYNHVDPVILSEFMRACKKKAISHTATGKNIPLQEELLEYSVSEDNMSIQEEVLTPPEVNYDEDKVSGSFDSGRMSETNRQVEIIQQEEPVREEVEAQRVSKEINQSVEEMIEEIPEAKEKLTISQDQNTIKTDTNEVKSSVDFVEEKTLKETAEVTKTADPRPNILVNLPQESFDVERQPQLTKSEDMEESEDEDGLLLRVIMSQDYVLLDQLLENAEFDPIDVLFELFEVDEQDGRLLKTVLLRWPDLNTTNEQGYSAIHLAAQARDTTYLKVLLHQSSILPNKGDAEGKTALMIAVESENFEGVDACLRACVVPFVKNAYGQSALDLVEDIDDLNIKTEMKSRIEQAIEMWKQKYSPEEIEKMSTTVGKEGKTLICQRRSTVKINPSEVKNFEDPLNESIRNFCLRSFQRLIDKQYPVNVALHEVARQGDRAAMFQILFRAGADVNSRNEANQTALHVVSERGKLRLIESLIDQPKCDIDAFDNEGQTPLMLAVIGGHPEVVITLLNACANPFLLNAKKESVHDISEELGGVKQAIIQEIIEEAIEEWADKFSEEELREMMTFFGQESPKKGSKLPVSMKSMSKIGNQTLELKPIDEDKSREENLSRVDEENLSVKKNQEPADLGEHSVEVTIVQDATQNLTQAAPKPEKEQTDIKLEVSVGKVSVEDQQDEISSPIGQNSGRMTAQATIHKQNSNQDIGSKASCMQEESLETNKHKHNQSECRPMQSVMSNMQQTINDSQTEIMDKELGATYNEQSIVQVSDKGQDSGLEGEKKKPISEASLDVLKTEVKVVDQDLFVQQVTEVIFDNEPKKLVDLLSQGLDSNLALLKICQFGSDQTELLEVVVKAGANVNYQEMNGRTALHFSCKREKISLVRLLLSQKEIQIDLRDNGGETALMKSVTTGNIELVRLILDAGANPLLTNGLKQSCKTLVALQSDDEDAKEISDLLTERVDLWRAGNSSSALEKQVSSPEEETFGRFIS